MFKYLNFPLFCTKRENHFCCERKMKLEFMGFSWKFSTQDHNKYPCLLVPGNNEYEDVSINILFNDLY